MLEGIRSPMMKEFNLTAEYYDSKDYHGLYHVADTAVSLDFEALSAMLAASGGVKCPSQVPIKKWMADAPI